MPAPVARIDRLTSKTLYAMKDIENVVTIAKSMGPELMPNPNVEDKLSSGFFKVTGADKFGIGLISDSDSEAVSEQGLDTY
jgi:hypothetical protein